MPALAVPDVDQGADVARPERRDGLSLFVEHARGAARDDQARGPQPRREAAGQRVGVHVEQLAPRAGADAGDDRHEAPRDERRDQRRRRRAAPARPRGPGPPSRRSWRGARAPSSRAPPRRPRPSAHGPPARGVDGRDEARVDGAGQHRDHDLERARIGDAQPVHLRFGMPSSPGAASISRPPPWTTASGPVRMGHHAPRHGGQLLAFSSSSPPSFNSVRVTAAPRARRGRT
jgi:hypothetical protein